MERIKTDALVIGGGPAGYAGAIRLSQLGVETLLIEKKRVGGTCLNVGCIPSKALLHVSGSYKKLRTDYEQIGITAENSQINWAKSIAWKDQLVKKIVGGVESLLKFNKIQVMIGSGKIIDQYSVEVAETSTIVEFKKLILATGSQIVEIPGFLFDHERILNSTDLLDLKSIPQSMIILGGGVIGMELGMVYAAIGCKTTVVEMAPQILINYEAKAVKLVQKSFEAMGGMLLTGTKALSCEKKGDGIELLYEKSGEKEMLTAEKLAVAVGRKPNIEGLNLAVLGIETEKGKIPVNDQMQTQISHVYAVGDLTEGPMLAHKATAEAVLAAEHISGEKVSRSDIHAIPDVVYTKPEIASVGMSEQQAKEAGFTIKTGEFPLAALGRAATTNETTGYIKYIAEADSERILGAIIVAANASELISEATLAIEMGATFEDIALTVHPHPTFGEAHMEASAAALGKAIHIFNR